jgi:hypothetical protein
VPRNRVIAALSAAALASALTLAGCASPPAAQAASPAAAAAVSSAPTAVTSQAANPAHLMIYSINSDGPYFRATLTGAVGDYGPAVTVLPDGTVDPQHSSPGS